MASIEALEGDPATQLRVAQRLQYLLDLQVKLELELVSSLAECSSAGAGKKDGAGDGWVGKRFVLLHSTELV